MEQANAHVLDADRAGMQTIKYTTRVEWLQARRSIITSTDVGPLAGISPFGTPLSVYAEKLDEGEPKEDVFNQRMLLGQILQLDVARAYQIIRAKKEEVLYELEPIDSYTLFLHARNHQHGTSMDAWSWLSGSKKLPLEIKTTAAYPDEPFEDWLTQVQWQMYVTGSHSATIAALCGGDDMRWWDIARDDDLIDMLRSAAEKFVSQHVLPRIPPPSDGRESSTRAIRRLFPQSDGSEVTMDAADMEHVVNINALKAQIDVLEQEQRQHEDALKAKMGAAEVAYLPNGGKITWKSFEKAGYIVKPSIVRAFKITMPGAGRGRK